MAPTRRVLTSEETQARDRLMQLSEEAEAAIERALSGFRNQDTALAQQVVEGDAQINDLQRQIEQGCFTAIALQQPMARDLRDLVSDMNIASELERIADHAAAIAKIVLQMDAPPLAAFVGSVERLGEECRRMLGSVMVAYRERDEQRARQAAADDDAVDRLQTQITADLLTHLGANPGQVTSCTHALWIVHNIERIGDRVTNIAERVVFMVTGEYVDLNC